MDLDDRLIHFYFFKLSLDSSFKSKQIYESLTGSGVSIEFNLRKLNENKILTEINILALMLYGVFLLFKVQFFNLTAMKTIKVILMVPILALFTACVFESTVPGRDGKDGDALLGSVFEVEGDFTPSNDWSLYYQFPASFEVYETDAVLVYILWDQVTDKFGKVQDVWRLLPQTVVLKEGILQYNFDYTVNDVEIFLGGTLDLRTLLPAESQDQIFRIVVLPADFAMYNSIDVTNFDLVLKSLSMQPEAIKRMDLTEIKSVGEIK
jgi:hypothetical protein